MSLKGQVTIEVYGQTETIQGSSFQRVPPQYAPMELQKQLPYHPASDFRIYKATDHMLAGEPEIYAIAEVSSSGAALADVFLYVVPGDIQASSYSVVENTLASTGHRPY